MKSCKGVQMERQLPLLHESIEDALTADILAAGGFKSAGYSLWGAGPEGKDSIECGKKLHRCVSTEHDQKLSLREILAIVQMAGVAGSYCTVNYLGLVANFKVVPVSPQEREAEALDRFDQVHGELSRLVAEFDSLKKART